MVRSRSGWAATIGFGHNASTDATIAAASSRVGAGLMVTNGSWEVTSGSVVAPASAASNRDVQTRTARVRTIMSWNVRFSESHNGHRNPR